MKSCIDEQPQGKGVQKLSAKHVADILSEDSKQVVGFLFEWNTGDREPVWEDGPHEDVIYA